MIFDELGLMATLEYLTECHGSHERVSLPDSMVEYLSIALFIVEIIIILLIGTAYTSTISESFNLAVAYLPSTLLNGPALID